MLVARWSLLRAAGVFVAALLPFGTFVIDGRLRREDEALQLRPNDAPPPGAPA
jgi:hypothetical protein